MSRIRTPLLLLAIVLSFLIVLAEIGQSFFDASSSSELGGTFSGLIDSIKNLSFDTPANVPSDFDGVDELSGKKSETPPGYAIYALVYIDAILCFTLALFGLPLVVKPQLLVKVQGIATFIFSLSLLLASIAYMMKVIVNLVLMITLLMAIPFGTIFYFILYASFSTGKAAAILSGIMFLKYVMAGSLIAAHERFLFNKGLIAIIATSLVATMIVGFLHSFLPSFLVSITDAIAAIIVCVIAIIWSIILLIGSIISIVNLIIQMRNEV